jgi:hypothetical protein
MRALFWVLLVANIIFFTVMQRGGWPSGDEQAVRAQPALHEDKIRLLDMREMATGAEAAPASAMLAHTGVCLEWGEFSGTDLARATAALSTLQLGDKLGQREVEHNIGYWVYIPPLKDKVAVGQKIAQLKARGVQEYFVVTESSDWHNAISLGVFKTQEAAQGFLANLRTKGVISAQAGERASKFKVTTFTLNGVDSGVESKLTALQKDFAGSELKNVPCAH